jgi:hypothetical protein
MADRLMVGQGSKSDIARLRILGYNESDINRLVNKGGTMEEYQGLPARLVTTQMGTDTFPAEKSLWHNQPYSNLVIGFDRYMATSFRYMNQILRGMYMDQKGTPVSTYTGIRKYMDNLKVLGTGFVPGKHWSPELNSTVVMGTVAGILAMEILKPALKFGTDAIRFGGGPGDEEDEERKFAWLRLFTDAFLSSQISGPLASWYNDVKRGEEIEKTLTKAVLPFAVPYELACYLSASRYYKNKDFSQRTEQFLRTNVPVSSTITTWAAMFNLMDKDTKFMATKSFVSTWKRQHGEVIGGGKTANEDEKYYIAINKAYEYMLKLEKQYNSKGQLLDQDIKGEEFRKIIKEIDYALNFMKSTKPDATTNEHRESVASSIESKQMFQMSPKNQELFLRTVDPKIIKVVADHDLMLQVLAKKIRNSKSY